MRSSGEGTAIIWVGAWQIPSLKHPATPFTLLLSFFTLPAGPFSFIALRKKYNKNFTLNL